MDAAFLVGLIVLAVVLTALAFAAGYFVRKRFAERLIRTAESKAREILVIAKREAEDVIKKADKESKQYLSKVQTDFDAKMLQSRKDLESLEKALKHREDTLGERSQITEKKEKETLFKLQEVSLKEKSLGEREKNLDALYAQQKEILQRLAKLDTVQARQELLKRMETELRQEASQLIIDIQEKARAQAEEKAREILADAINRCAAEHSMDSTVTTVALSGEEMKGRIIGKDGRNIKTFETLTGVDLIIDDTPGAVVLSAFDGYRRQIAKIALEELIKDGRIQPARIEEVVQKTKKDMENILKEEGDRVCAEAKVVAVHPEIVKLLGRLKFRSSHGQNVLLHSLETAQLMSVICSEMGLDPVLGRRAGLLHDIGKASGPEAEGSHALVGGELARRYGEHPDVVHAIEAHHGDIPCRSVWPVLVQAADAASASRPGARRESLESYVHRLSQLEAIADRHPGVEKSYVIQGGREIRVMIKPDRVPEQQMKALAREIAKEIEANLQFPGQIKVVLIRESRVEDAAK